MQLSFLSLLALGFSTTYAAPYYFHQPYSAWMVGSIINNNLSTPDFSYTNAVFYRGVEYVYNATSNPQYLDFLEDQVGALLSPNGTFTTWDREPGAQKSLDDVRIGETILYLYQLTNSSQYRGAADFLHSFLLSQGRTPSGGFWHRDPRYEDQMWLDGIFMADTFYAHYVSLFQPHNTTAWDDILLQFTLIESRTRNETTGLLVHGYDEAHDEVWSDPITGAAPHVWNRALGWYFMALVDILDYFPSSHPGYEILMGFYTSLAAALLEFQDPESNGWWLIMEPPYPGAEGNYIESSGTAMFTYGFLKGMRMGYLSEEEYLGPAQAAYDLMIDRFVVANGTNCTLNWEGTVEVGSLSGNATYQYYIGVPLQENDFKGVGSFAYASAELEMRD